jgi:hypothetical protein
VEAASCCQRGPDETGTLNAQNGHRGSERALLHGIYFERFGGMEGSDVDRDRHTAEYRPKIGEDQAKSNSMTI